VRDWGKGIEPAQLHHVFDRYWRESPAAGGGSGLGLYLAKGIVDAHGGKLWAQSRVGIGSTFFFTLPLRENPSLRALTASRRRVGATPRTAS
jgi:signal transduction histidine kinase